MTATLFSWGYYGWGEHTPELVGAVDAVEAARGFAPPLFVDVRIRRSVRAAGFTGPSFERLLGAGRHVWMRSLGNRHIVTREGPPIQIAEPGAATELLTLARDAAANGRRVIFFCSCQWPRLNGEVACHRTTVADLVLAAAEREGRPVRIVEWPGGEPTHIDLTLSSEVFRAVRKGRMSIPLGPDAGADLLGLPWGSVATLRCGGEPFHRVVGRAERQKGQWSLPVLDQFFDPAVGLAEYELQGGYFRREHGLEPKGG